MSKIKLFLEFFIELGIIGFILAFVFIFYWLRINVGTSLGVEDRKLEYVSEIVFWYFLAHTMFGGDIADADGVWATITVDGGFILGPDILIQRGANPEDSLGTDNRWDFNISPLGGSDVASARGELFNVQFTFSEAGEKQIGFQEFNGVNRTYYTDMATGEERFWGSHVGATIDVN